MDTKLAITSVFVVFSCMLLGLRSRPRGTLPPGPRPSLFGGTAPSRALPWQTFAQLRNIFGDIVYIRSFGNSFVILNSAKAIQDLLDKRSAIYSSRPNRLMILDVMGWSCMFSEMLYGQTWRKHRSLFEKHYNSRVVGRYEPIHLEEARILLRGLLESPENFAHHLQRSATALITTISYDYRIKSLDDPYVTLANRAMGSIIKAGLPGTYWIDWVPLLNYVPRWFPAPFRQVGNACRSATKDMIDVPFESVKTRMTSGQDIPCIVSMELQEKLENEDDLEQISTLKNIAAMGYAAGGETTVSALHTFMLAMVLDPNVQRKAQAQIDACIGSEDRLPLFSDRARLPYIDHIVWEVLRWNPVVPLALPHATLDDDFYEGYWIPKGTTVIPNIWAIFHDKEKYPDPFSFIPERFEEVATNEEQGINEVPWAAFGFGRRICPGRWLAIDTLWISVAYILAVYDISKAVDQNGHPIEPTQDYTLGLSSRPKPFVCSIIPRSDAAIALIKGSE